jgi:phosphonate transport system ATP-binding protein
MPCAPSLVTPAIKVTGLTKTVPGGKALDCVDLTIHPGETVALLGGSGSGKSTLLRQLTGFSVGDADQGSVELLGQPVQACGHVARGVRRLRSRVGVIFRQSNLVDRLPVMTNLLVGALGRTPSWRSLTGFFDDDDIALARTSLERVGLGAAAQQHAAVLTAAQQQRAAIARALVQRAEVILADEPVALLEPEAAQSVMEMLLRLNAEDGTTLLVSLRHRETAVRYFSRVVALKEGRVVYDGDAAALTPTLLRSLFAGADETAPAGTAPPRMEAQTVAEPRRQAGMMPAMWVPG